MKISFIATVFNEEKAIKKLLNSIFSQTELPDEVILVDGGSTDTTVSVISNYKFVISNKKRKLPKLILLVKKGNRSVGRNAAIKKASGDIIVCSDAGCTLDKNWMKNIVEPFKNTNVDVVAGYYKGKTKNVFEKSLVPYVLVMPERVDSKNFLPASRSMGFRKNIWKKAGGFDERYSHNEDYVFAKNLRDANATIVFEKRAIVYWMPRKNILQAFWMFFRFARGDMEALIFRPKVVLLFLRYFLYGYLFFLNLLYKSIFLTIMLIVLLVLYLFWSIQKNYHYVQNAKAIFYLPLLQLTADVAVASGSIIGLVKYMRLQTLLSTIKNNKSVTGLIIFYIVLMLSLINWGIPSNNHPFTYFMDEWHQLQAVRAVFTQGTSNIEGAANGSMLHFFLSGILLTPFILLKIVDVSAISSSVEALVEQERLFQILRLQTLVFGVVSIILLTYITKKYFKTHPFIAIFLFIVNPLWLSLSNYFKYDIALVFWILFSFLFFIRLACSPTISRFVFLGILCGVTLAVKISAAPLIAIYFFSFFLFYPKAKDNLHVLMLGLVVFAGTFATLGIPDLIVGRGDMTEYLDSVLRRTPQTEAANTKLGMHYLLYFLTRTYPISFGHMLYFGFILTVIGFCSILLVHIKNRAISYRKVIAENKHFIIVGLFLLFFGFSIFTLRFEGRGNRLLPLLPFMTLIIAAFVQHISQTVSRQYRGLLYGVLSILIIIQIFVSYAWVTPKLYPDPRQTSSAWITANIPTGTTIGIENIPIYQMIPDVLLKEYYFDIYKKTSTNRFRYVILTQKTTQFPDVIVVTNDLLAQKYYHQSLEKIIVQKLKKANYKKISQFFTPPTELLMVASDRDYIVAGLIFIPETITVYGNINDK